MIAKRLTIAIKCENKDEIKHMKNIILAAFLCVPATLMGATEVPSTLKGYLPADTFVKGANVKVDFGKDFAEATKPIQEGVAKASKEVLAEVQKVAKPDEPLPFDERLGFTKEAYDKYIKAWQERKLVPVEEVIARWEPSSDGKWKIKAISATNGQPLPLTTLEYDSKADSWSSPNGELKRQKDDVNFSKDNLFGQWKGPQWLYEDKSSLGTVVENFAVGKSDDGKNIFLVYRLVELASTGQPTWQNMYVIRIDGADLKKDPLKEAAKNKAADKKN